MSLLLDALKRAEEAKRQAGQPGRETPATAETLSLTPKEESASALPDLNSHIETVDQELRAEASAGGRTGPRPAAPAQPAAGGAAQAAARNVFAAKPAAQQSRPKTLLVAGVAGGIAALGIAGYFGYQYLQLTGALAPPPMAPAAAPRPPAAAAPIAASTLPATDAPAVAAAPQADPGLRPAAGPLPAPNLGPGAIRPSRPPGQSGQATRASVPAPGSDGERSPVRVSSAPSAVDARLSAAYGALQSGQLTTAEAGYRDVLAREPGNIDAQLGLAVIAARAGRLEDAQARYLAVLDAAPRNAAAQAGLLSLSGAIPATQRESRLKQLLATPPADPTLAGLLHFALGNVYGEQQRWAEAQAAYFEATVADRDNPDYLYNLAVSLEHLQKPALAARQYEAAVRAARQRPHAFELDLASARAAALAR